MRKLLLAGIFLALGVVLALPWLLGGQVQAAYADMVSGLSDQGLRVLNARYERGWLSSHAVADLVADSSAGPAGATAADLQVRIASRVHHGPWSLDLLRASPAAAVIESRVETHLPGVEPPPLLLHTVVDLNGGGVVRMRLPARERPPGAAQPGMRSAEGRGELRFDPGFASLAGWFDLPSFEILWDTGRQLRVQGLRGESTGSRWIGDLLVGRSEVALDGLSLRDGSAATEVRTLAIATRAVPQGQRLDMRTELRLADLKRDGAKVGPAQATLSVTGLDGAALAALQRSLREQASNPVGPPLSERVAPYLRALLEHDPRLTLEGLKVATPQGEVDARLSMRVRDLGANAVTSPAAWLQHLDGTAELGLPKAVLLDLMVQWQRVRTLADLRRSDPEVPDVPPEMDAQIATSAHVLLAALVRDGWVAEQSGRVETSARLADGLLSINGKTLPLGLLGLP